MYLGAITLLTNCSYTMYKNNQAATTLTIDPKRTPIHSMAKAMEWIGVLAGGRGGEIKTD